eukprot:GGOE01056588.1.p3 GENE.GGOE01056588.1~~GGOE01056588.1.p3  ORF type:complete len:104 (+),score=2.99 GGOE01056588.1:1-312(+)
MVSALMVERSFPTPLAPSFTAASCSPFKTNRSVSHAPRPLNHQSRDHASAQHFLARSVADLPPPSGCLQPPAGHISFLVSSRVFSLPEGCVPRGCPTPSFARS